MNVSPRIQIVISSLIGAVAIQAAFAACSGGATPSPFDSTHARADAAATPCSTWQVQSFLPSSFTFRTLPITNADGTPDKISQPTFDAFALPAGWEPFAAGEYGAITARRCTAP
jgi:hypothetical protein